MISPETLAKLRLYDTPTVCNVIELFDARPYDTGYMDERIRAAYPELPPMVGFAATATFRASFKPASGDVYSGVEQQVQRFEELPGPPVVVFQDLDSPVVAATFGEVMCTTYQAFGAVGLITSGAGRDLEQVHRINFPVFTSGAICSHGYYHTPSIHVPVHVGGIPIFPGDLLHGDLNGVTTIPLDIAADVADACAEFVAAEAVLLDLLHQGRPEFKRYQEARAESKRMMAALRQRVSRKV